MMIRSSPAMRYISCVQRITIRVSPCPTDVLSTALYVMGPEEGLAWAAARGIAACFLLPGPDSGDVTFRATPAFEARFPLPLSSEEVP